MTIDELIRELSKYKGEKEIVVFAAGNVYPTLSIDVFEEEIEIACGWEPKDYPV